MTLPKVVHGTQKSPPGAEFDPRPKDVTDRKADRILNEGLDAANRPIDKGARYSEKVADCILEKQGKGK